MAQKLKESVRIFALELEQCLADLAQPLLRTDADAQKALANVSDIKDAVCGASDLISHNVTKLTLLLPRDKDGQATPAIVRELHNQVLFMTILMRVLLSDSGPTLSRAIVQRGTKLLESVIRLISVVSKYKDGSQIPTSLAGCVWEACKEMKTMPFRNSHAICRKILELMSLMKDGFSELSDMHDNAMVDESGLSGEMENMDLTDESKEGDIYDDLDDDFDDPAFSQTEKDTLESCLRLIKSSQSIVKFIYMFVARVAQSKCEESSEDIQWMEALCLQCQSVGANVDELAVTLYPPHSKDALVQAIECIRDTSDKLACTASQSERLACLTNSPAKHQKWLKKERLKLDKAVRKTLETVGVHVFSENLNTINSN
eukprot:78173_1